MLQQISAALLTIIQLLLALFGFPAKELHSRRQTRPVYSSTVWAAGVITTRSMRLPHTGA